MQIVSQLSPTDDTIYEMANLENESTNGALQSEAAASTKPSTALPITLLSGFLGAGKTTLLQHILKSDHGLRIAVIVNDMAGINVDASLIKQTYRLKKSDEKVIALQNGCICCSLRGDLLEELLDLWKLQKFDYVIIESSGVTEPEQVAETFDSRLSELALSDNRLDEYTMETLKEIKDAGGLENIARLDTTVTVIDAFTIIREFHTDELLSSRQDTIEPTDERTVSDLMADQIEFADVILLNKIDMVDGNTKDRIISLVKQLNHRANILESSYGKIDLKHIVNTNLFDLEAAQTGSGWLQDLHAMTVQEFNGGNEVKVKSKARGYNVQSLVYSRYRPFHPRRLFALLYDKFILQMEHPDDEEDEDKDEDGDGDVGMGGAEDDGNGDLDMTESDGEAEFETPSNEVILENKRNHPLLAPLLRSKGQFFLATRPYQAGNWSQAGTMLTLTGGAPWFCTLAPEEYATGDLQVDRLIAHDIKKGGEWGDRRQELVLIGEKLNHDGLKGLLDECLLTDEEFGIRQEIMRDISHTKESKWEALCNAFEDGFPDWPGDDHEHSEHDHEHSQGHAGHSHAGHSHLHARGARPTQALQKKVSK